MTDLMKALETKPVTEHPDFRPGDSVRVHVRIVEGNRERIQIFHGTIIRISGGGNDKTFTVRRIASHGIGVERIFLVNSPRVEQIEVIRRAKVRRSKLFYLRTAKGKAARLKERRF